MAETQKKDNKYKNKIVNIEHMLPKIEILLAGREADQTKYTSLNLRLPILKKEFYDTEDKYIQLKNEIIQVDTTATNLYFQREPSRLTKFREKILFMWRESRTLFFAMIMLIMTLAAIIIATFYQNIQLQSLIFYIGFSLVGVIIFVGSPKYRIFIIFFLLAMLIFIYTNFITDIIFKWTLFSAAVALIALGFAYQAFYSDEAVEHKLEQLELIEKKMNEILERLPNPTPKN